MGEYLVGRAIQNQGKDAKGTQGRNQRMQRTLGDRRRRAGEQPGLQPANIGNAIREELAQAAKARRRLIVQTVFSLAVTLAIHPPLIASILSTRTGEERLATSIVATVLCVICVVIPVAFTAGAGLRTARFVERLQAQIGLAPTTKRWVRLNQLNLAASVLPLFAVGVMACL